MIEYPAGERAGKGYLALPEVGHGPGVLVLHAWWGLTQTFTDVCDRLAGAGFVAFAPDLYGGATASTIEAAQALLEGRDFETSRTRVTGALALLHAHPATDGDGVGALGFSMGAAWALFLSTLAPAEIAAVVVFYGSEAADFTAAHASYLGHFAEDDEWEPIDGVRQMAADLRAAGRSVDFYTYPRTHHWFFEPDRPEYDPAAAELAWDRTLDFLQMRLGGG
jgi:carboxymethylenebutenolidase